MTDQIEQRLQEIEERNHYAFDKEHDSVWKFRNAVSRSAEDVLALCKVVRRALELMRGDYEFTEDGNAIRKHRPRIVINIDADIAQILAKDKK